MSAGTCNFRAASVSNVPALFGRATGVLAFEEIVCLGNLILFLINPYVDNFLGLSGLLDFPFLFLWV